MRNLSLRLCLWQVFNHKTDELRNLRDKRFWSRQKLFDWVRLLTEIFIINLYQNVPWCVIIQYKPVQELISLTFPLHSSQKKNSANEKFTIGCWDVVGLKSNFLYSSAEFFPMLFSDLLPFLQSTWVRSMENQKPSLVKYLIKLFSMSDLPYLRVASTS